MPRRKEPRSLPLEADPTATLSTGSFAFEFLIEVRRYRGVDEGSIARRNGSLRDCHNENLINEGFQWKIAIDLASVDVEFGTNEEKEGHEINSEIFSSIKRIE